MKDTVSFNDMVLYSVGFLARKLGVCRRTLLRRIRCGKLRALPLGKSYYVTEDALQEFLALNGVRKSTSKNKHKNG